MAITKTRIVPPSPEVFPIGGGRLAETWTLTHDGSATTAVLTPATFNYVESVIGSTATNSGAGTTVTMTYAAALTNGLVETVLLIGRKW